MPVSIATATKPAHAPAPAVPGARLRARRWMLTALAFPPSGLAAVTVTAVDRPVGGLVGGAIVGIGIGTAQWLALRTSAPRLGLTWVATTGAAMSAGLAVGAAAVDWRTTPADLVVMGLLTGAVLGPAQGVVLRRRRLATGRGAALWAAAVPLLWALGWSITAAAGVDVERRYAVFGATGAAACAALGSLVLRRIVHPSPPVMGAADQRSVVADTTGVGQAG